MPAQRKKRDGVYKMDKPILLTAKEASDILRVPLSTLYRLTKKGQIKGFKVGKQWRYKKEDIFVYFNAGVRFNDMAVERRQYQRIKCRIPCNFGIIRNISAGGVLVEAPQEPVNLIHNEDPVQLQFTIHLNDENMFVRSEARVVRIANNTLGIKFRDLSEEVRERVLDYVGE